MRSCNFTKNPFAWAAETKEPMKIMKLRHTILPVIAGAALLAACERREEAPPAPTETPETTPAETPAPPPGVETTPAPAPPAEPTIVTPPAPDAPAPPVPDAPAPDAPATPPDAPQTDAEPLPDPVAVVNGTPITRTEFEDLLNQTFGGMGLDPAMLPQEQRAMLYHRFLDDLIIDRLVEQAAAETEVTDAEVDQELASIVENFESQEQFAEELARSGQSMDELRERITGLMRQRKWMEAHMGEDSQPTDEQARAFYDENIQEFEQPDMVRASHILFLVDEDADEETVQTRKAQADAATKRARDGEDFAALAGELSEEPGAGERGGDLDFFPRDRMVPEFADAAFGLEVDEISEPVRTRFGWHVIKKTGQREASTVPYDEVRTDILEYLSESGQQEVVEAVVQTLRENADVQINLPDPPAQPPATTQE